MAEFPITYTKALPSGRAPVVRARVDVREGTGVYGRGLVGIGKALLEIDKAAGVVEFSTLKREIDELGNDAFIARSQVSEQEARDKIDEQLLANIEAKISTRNWVNRELEVFKNSIIPEWRDTFAKQDLAIQTRQVDDAAEINIQKYLAMGDVGEAAKEIMILRKLNRISEAEAEQRIKDLPVEAVFAQAAIDIGNNNPQMAIAKLNTLKDLPLDKLKRKNELMRMAEQTGRDVSDEFAKSILDTILKADQQDLTPMQKSNLVDNLKSQITQSGLSGAEARVWFDYVERWGKDEDVETNWNTFDSILTDIEAVGRGEIDADDVKIDIRKALLNDLTLDRVAANFLRKKLSTFIDSIEDLSDVLNRASVKRGLAAFRELKTFNAFITADEVDELSADEAKALNIQRWMALSDEFERRVKETKDLTDEKVREIHKSLTEEAIEKTAESLLNRLWRKYKESPFGFLWREEKPEIKKKLTAEIARRYLDLVGGDREKAKRMAADDGYVE